MKSKTRELVLCGAVALCAAGVHAPANAQAAGFVTYFIDTGLQYLTNKAMEYMGLGVEAAATQAGAATQAEVAKAAMATKATLEGVQQYEMENKLRMQMADASASLQQPPSTCSTLAVQDGVSKAAHNKSLIAKGTHSGALAKLRSNTNSVALVDQSFTEGGSKFCTPEEQKEGICSASAVPAAYRQLAGADQNAAFLFQAEDGSPTYTGGQDGPQTKAAQQYIARIVASIPPEQLRKTDYSKSPQARAHAELMRRYNAMMSMSSYSLSQVLGSRSPQTRLGEASGMATVSARGFAPNKVDMSMTEVVQRFIATKFSPDSIKGSSTATSPNLILRDIAQMSSFQLWLDYQSMLQDSRTEALLAHQLALETERTLRPQLDAQRMVATTSNAK